MELWELSMEETRRKAKVFFQILPFASVRKFLNIQFDLVMKLMTNDQIKKKKVFVSTYYTSGKVTVTEVSVTHYYVYKSYQITQLI